MRLLLVLLACGGCDVLFQLNHVPPQDASVGEPLPDGSAVAHDEDGDGVPDVSDNCPTVSNADQLNLLEIQNGQSADDVGDACDPHPMEPGDRIALFEPFTTLGDFDQAGTVTAITGDSVMLGGDSAILSRPAVSAPTLAAVQLSWTGALTDQNLATLTVGSNGVACGMQICGTGTCVYASESSSGTLGIGWGANASDLIEIRFAAANEQCDIVSVANTGTLTPSYPFMPGKVGFSTRGPNAAVVLRNLIVYGH